MVDNCVKKCRKRGGLTLQELADLSGVPASTEHNGRKNKNRANNALHFRLLYLSYCAGKGHSFAKYANIVHFFISEH